MQYTTNYNLLLPEGTDIVNPLTDVNPNFSTLDTTVKGVSDKTVSGATEVTVGTAHGITRANPDCNVFAFTATSNWTTGDTITVDGTAVTALKSDGTTLKTGDYVIGSSVLCILQSTRLTVLVSSAAPTAAADITYDNTVSGLAATDVQDAIDEINSDLSQNIVAELVTASSPVTVLANDVLNTTINVAKSGYTAIGIIGVFAFSSSLTFVEYGLLNATTARIYYKNLSSVDVTGTPSATILYKKN